MSYPIGHARIGVAAAVEAVIGQVQLPTCLLRIIADVLKGGQLPGAGLRHPLAVAIVSIHRFGISSQGSSAQRIAVHAHGHGAAYMHITGGRLLTRKSQKRITRPEIAAKRRLLSIQGSGLMNSRSIRQPVHDLDLATLKGSHGLGPQQLNHPHALDGGLLPLGIAEICRIGLKLHQTACRIIGHQLIGSAGHFGLVQITVLGSQRFLQQSVGS